MIDLSDIVKAYDVRGIVREQLDRRGRPGAGRRLRRRSPGPRRLAAGHDMRESGPQLLAAFAEGATSQGADVVDIGLASTDLLYFASGQLDLPGAMFTASHNPARYNGIKLCRAGAAAGRRRTPAWSRSGRPPRATWPTACPRRSAAPGTVSEQRPAGRLRPLPARPGGPVRHPAAEGGGRRRQRHGRLHRAGGARRRRARPRCRWRSSRCTSSWTAASPTTRPTRWSRPTWSTCSAGWSRSAPISGWPSTATPTGASSSTPTAIRSRPARSPRWSRSGSWPRRRARRSSTT